MNVCIIATLVVITLLLMSLLASCLLSLPAVINVNPIKGMRRIYYNGEVTYLIGKIFDLRYFEKVNITTIPKDNFDSVSYNITVCQTSCTNKESVTTMLNLNFTRQVNTRYKQDSIRFPGFSCCRVKPSPFGLRGSQLNFSFIPLNSSFESSVVTLSYFTDVNKCTEFGEGSEDSVAMTIKLNVSNGFNHNFVSRTDDNLCFIIELERGTEFNYTVTTKNCKL